MLHKMSLLDCETCCVYDTSVDFPCMGRQNRILHPTLVLPVIMFILVSYNAPTFLFPLRDYFIHTFLISLNKLKRRYLLRQWAQNERAVIGVM